ncbi:phage tail fiber protein [Klebsiella quasipneumoniae]|uniref:phage tail fiber domain-containing protein n=1 Tax=Klebsiella quasipneumoniae TaxID=1463165 RepID=UPI00351E54AE
MSVPNQTPYNIYTANGLSTVFAYEFYLISASDIQVTINGSDVTSGYTVSGVGNTGGGAVTFLTAPSNGSTVILERVTPTYRLTDYQDNGDLLADTVNKDFDRLWMAIQRAFIYLGVALSRPLFGGGPFNANGYRIANLADPVNDQDAATKKFVVENGKTNLARTLRVPELAVTELPSLNLRKNKVLAFNSEGNPIAVLPGEGTATDVMIELSSSEKGKGGALIMLEQKITVQDALKGVVVVSGADGTGVIDATEIIQAYLDYARDHGINTVRLPPGDYKVQKYTHQIELPHDDGTVYPGWVSSGSDINLAPEPVHYIYAALKLHPGIFLTGDTMLTTTINGGWDIATGPIGKDSGIGVWFSTSNMQSDHLGGGLINIGMRNFFIGRYGTGCTVDTVEDRIYHKNCAIAAIFQAKERCKHGFIHVEPGYAGDVVGGQWWYRSDSVSARHIPPYPAPQIYLTSWMDACLFEKYWFVQYDEAFGARHEAIDNFFDTYFMKSANHARQAEGGRLSNTSGGGSINKFKGIVGRAIYTPALYGQQPNANLLLSLKTYGTHRTAVATGENAVNSGAMNFIQSAYIERSGLVSPFGTIGAGNYFGIDYVDLWEPARVGVGYSVVDGFFGMGKILRSTGQPAAYGSFRSYNQESAPTRKTIFIDSIEDPNLFEYSEQYDKAGRSSVPYRRYSDKCYMPPVMFNDGSRQFSFVHNSFSATLLSTDAAIMSGTGYYCRKGNEITLRVAFTVPVATLASISGYIRISGLPYTMSFIGYSHGSVRWPALVSGTRLNPQIDAGQKTIKLFIDSAENEAVGATVINRAYGSSSLFVISLTYRTDDI